MLDVLNQKDREAIEFLIRMNLRNIQECFEDSLNGDDFKSVEKCTLRIRLNEMRIKNIRHVHLIEAKKWSAFTVEDIEDVAPLAMLQLTEAKKIMISNPEAVDVMFYMAGLYNTLILIKSKTQIQ